MTGSRQPRIWRRNRIYCRIELSPLFITIFALLPVFMIWPEHPYHHGFLQYLARTSHPSPLPGAVREDAMQISISAPGDVYYRYRRINPGDLRAILKEGLRSGAERRVYVSVDGRTNYGDVEKALDGIRSAGLTDISFMTEQ